MGLDVENIEIVQIDLQIIGSLCPVSENGVKHMTYSDTCLLS